MAVKQRARKDEDKQARRIAILDTASRLLANAPFNSITMAEVARSCQLGKGTLYLYFRSKEELFLAKFEEEICAWFDDLAQRILEHAPVEADDFGRVVAASLASRDQLARLLPILHTILEQNVDIDTALAFKRVLRERVLAGAKIVEHAMPRLPRGQGATLLLRIHALAVGLHEMSQTTPAIAALLELEEFTVLRVEFEPSLATAVADLVRGMMRETPSTSPARVFRR